MRNKMQQKKRSWDILFNIIPANIDKLSIAEAQALTQQKQVKEFNGTLAEVVAETKKLQKDYNNSLGVDLFSAYKKGAEQRKYFYKIKL